MAAADAGPARSLAVVDDQRCATVKTGIDQLAVFGGAPAFARPVHVGRPNLPHREKFLERMASILERGQLTNNGPCVRELESRIAERVGVRHCVAVCNATSGLEIATRALGMRDEVIVPAMTFVATAHALRWQGITPVFCDIDPETYNLDPASVEGLITPRTTGIVGVHLWGRPCDVDALERIARTHRLALCFDAAHAFGCSSRGRRIGRFGDAEVFSFHATKFVHSFEGGAVVTDDADLARRVRMMTNFGFVGYDRVDFLGINGKMSEAAAAMGLTSLDGIDEIVAANRRNYRIYLDALDGIEGVRLMRHAPEEESNFQYIVLEIDPDVLGIERDDVVRVLHAENVLARRYFHPGCHRMAPYRDESPEAGGRLAVTERLVARVICLPTGLSVSAADACAVASIVRLVSEHGPSVRDRLHAAQESA